MKKGLLLVTFMLLSACISAEISAADSPRRFFNETMVGLFPEGTGGRGDQFFSDCSDTFRASENTSVRAYFKSLFGLTRPELWRTGASIERNVTPAHRPFTLTCIAGSSLGTSGGNWSFSVDGGLDARYRLLPWLSIESRLTNFFFSDAVLSELMAGVRFHSIFTRHLSVALYYPATSYKPYTPAPAASTRGIAALNIKYHFSLDFLSLP